jgi:DnaJ-class molecular chaperone
MIADCSTCHGKGYVGVGIHGKTCPDCGGKKKVQAYSVIGKPGKTTTQQL